MLTMIDEMLLNVRTAAIFGHVRPDGDCVGSALALYNYIKDNFPQVEVKVFLEKFPETYGILRGADSVLPEYSESAFASDCDIAFLLDAPSFERVGANGVQCINNAKFTCNIDHHVSNPQNLCTKCFLEAQSSSTCETLYFLMDKGKISTETASCLYLGIVHDTGAFKYSCTGRRTMNVVGDLIDKGVDFTKIVNETYYTRTYKQTLITGYVLENCKLGLDGKVVYSIVTEKDMENFGVQPVDLSNVIDTLREVGGTEVAVFIYPANGKYKVSLRSNYIVDVNAIAKTFGGGGHVRAAGGDFESNPEFAIQKILMLIDDQL